MATYFGQTTTNGLPVVSGLIPQDTDCSVREVPDKLDEL